MILSLGFMKMERALSKVVFPELVPPETMMFAGLTPNPSTQSHKKEAISLFNVLYLIKSMIVKGSFLNFRMVIVGPSADNGGMVALTLEPSLKRASRIGDCWSMRRFTLRAIELIMEMILHLRCQKSNPSPSCHAFCDKQKQAFQLL